MSRLEFDSTQLGNLEVEVWKAHNDKDKPKMLELLVAQNIAMYGFDEDSAKTALQFLAEGIKYHDTREWEKAVDSVVGYYERVKEHAGLQFNPREMSELQVGWWKLHDELEHNPDKSRLSEAFAKLYATEFGVTIESVAEAGRLKAEATREHDLAEDPNTPTDQIGSHWNKANALLITFYEELNRVLN